jgi:ribonuclease HI
MIAYCDGAGFNGEISRYCIAIPETKKYTIFKTSDDRTSNEMEYEAVLHALMYNEFANEKITLIYTDSQLVVGHLTQNWRVNADNLRPFYNEARKLLRAQNVQLQHIKRNRNLAGKILEGRIPNEFIESDVDFKNTREKYVRESLKTALKDFIGDARRDLTPNKIGDLVEEALTEIDQKLTEIAGRKVPNDS